MEWSKIFPAVDNEYQGPALPFYFLVLVAILSTARSLVHVLAADGGAQTIAGIAVNHPGGENIIPMFAQWGVSQLVLACFYWLTILRYRFLTPFMLLIVLLEQLLRIGVAQLKPLTVTHSPPGAIGSYVLIPLTLVAFLLSLHSASQKSSST